ncbi:MAG: hypothetical protein M0P71_12020 [Melioribacteraceae bacterium]|jgi:hypothetical protein|nr:hypothetical protein [Melioribacteraceae bacterium]
MADKVVLTSVDIDVEKAIQDTQALKERVAQLRAETDNLKKTQGETSKEYILASANLKANQAELRVQENLIAKVVTANQSNIGSLDAMKAELSIVSKQWSALSESERLNTDQGKKLTARKLELTNALKKEEIATGDARRNVGNYNDVIGKSTTSLAEMVPGFGTASKAAKVFGISLNAALWPITLIVAAIAGLIASLKRSEEGQNQLAKAMAVFKVVLNNIMDIVTKLAETLFKAFENPKQAIMDLGNAIKENLINRLEAFKVIALSFKKIFSKDWKEGFKELANGTIQLTTGVENMIDKIANGVKNLIDESKKEIDIALKLAAMREKLEKRIRAEIVNDARDQAKIAELRAKAAEKDKLTGEERLKLLDQAIEIQRAMMKDDLDIAKQKAYIHGQEMAMSAQTKEAKEEQARLEAEIFNIQKANSEAERGFQRQRQSAINDMIEDQRKLAESSVEQMMFELEMFKLANKDKIDLTGETVRRQEEILKEALRIKIDEIDAKENESEALKNAQKLELQNDYLLQVAQLNSEFDEAEKQRKIEVAQTDYENNLAIAEESIFAQLEIELEGLTLKEQQEIEAAERIGASTELIEKKYAKAKIAIARTERDAKLALAGDFAKNIATLAGEQTAIGKAAAVAGTTIDTFRGAQAAFTGMTSTIPGPVGIALGIAAAAAAVASGLANVKKILAVKSGLPGEGSGGGGSVSGGSTPAQPRVVTSVNPEIGQGIVSRQIGDAGKSIETPQSEKVVVIDEVTAKQKLDSSQQKTSVL